jgi:indolepyruvate decarboxylase
VVWIPEVLNAGKGFDVRTEGQLEQALKEARKNTESSSIFDVHIDPQDRSLALQRLTNALGKRVKR